MSAYTKAQLLEANAALTAQVTQLTAMLVEVDQHVVNEIAVLKQQLLDMASVASALNRKPQRSAYMQPQWQIDKAAAMAAAKALAISSHLQVRV